MHSGLGLGSDLTTGSGLSLECAYAWFQGLRLHVPEH